MGGFLLEKVKFAVFLFAPILAVVVYSIPAVHETHMKMARYVVHPPSVTLEYPIRRRIPKGEAASRTSTTTTSPTATPLG